jgi:hypothetical protein
LNSESRIHSNNSDYRSVSGGARRFLRKPDFLGVDAMADYLAAIPLVAIQRLRCEKCHARMVLAHISPGPGGFEHRTFDCTSCDHVEKIAIALDPMKSGDVGWLVGELHPPP